MAQHEPNMVPTWPKMSQHSPKWPKISPIWSQLLPNKGQQKPQNTTKMAQHSPIRCQRWPNIPEARNMGKNEAHGAKTAPSCSVNQKFGLHTLHAPPWAWDQAWSGKHRLSAACRKKEKRKHKITSNTFATQPNNCVFLGIYGIFLQTPPCMDENSPTQKCPSPRQRPTKYSKMAQHEPKMMPMWPRMAQHSPKWPKISSIWSQLWPTQTPKYSKMHHHEPSMVPT